MRRATVWAVACLVGTIGCKGGKGAKEGTPGEPAATEAKAPAAPAATDAPPAPAPEPAAPAEVTAEVKQDGDAGKLSAVIRVTIAGEAHELRLDSDLKECESTEASVDEIADIGDNRLRMVQLFCESGEDYFTRTMVTSLLLAGPEPKILWQGEGSYSNSMDECESIDVLHFRRGAGGKVEAVRTTQVTSETDDELCEPAPEKQTVVETIDVPPRAP